MKLKLKRDRLEIIAECEADEAYLEHVVTRKAAVELYQNIDGVIKSITVSSRDLLEEDE